MRKIKFRLIKDGEIVGYENHYTDESLGVGIGVYHNPVDSELIAGHPITGGDVNYIIHDKKEQYTGLKDRNDQEIYDGDIMETGSGRIMQVECYRGGFGFFVDKWSPFEQFVGFAGHFHFDEIMSKIRIIGNIHENKDLLK